LLPAALLLLHSVVSTATHVVSPPSFALGRSVVPGRASAQLPAASYDPRATASPFGARPAASGVVVLHLGLRFSHPVGPLAPGGKALADHAAACNADVLARARDFGCLGATTWRGVEAASGNATLTVYYFRSVEGLNAFAHDAVHRRAWDWYRDVGRRHGFGHLGIYHEAFYSPPGSYETIYVNMPPVLLGAASALTRNEATGEDEWLRPLVAADVPALRSQLSRMGRAAAAEEGKAGEESG